MGLFSILMSSSLLIGAEGRAPLPNHMALLGDSISEGLFSDYSLHSPPKWKDFLSAAGVLFTSLNNSKRVIEFRKKFANKNNSWASSLNSKNVVFSHYERIKKYRPQARGENFAVTGAESWDLAEQVDRLKKFEAENELLFDYIVLLIGANDLFADSLSEVTPTKDFLSNVETTLRKILDEDPRRSIYVVGIPDIISIFEETDPFTVYKVAGEKIKCSRIRKMIFGDKLLFREDDSVEYPQIKQMIEDYRIGLDDLTATLQEDYPDSHLLSLQRYKISQNIKRVLSFDCFHPSQMGQAELAEFTWLNGFWPEY